MAGGLTEAIARDGMIAHAARNPGNTAAKIAEKLALTGVRVAATRTIADTILSNAALTPGLIDPGVVAEIVHQQQILAHPPSLANLSMVGGPTPGTSAADHGLWGQIVDGTGQEVETSGLDSQVTVGITVQETGLLGPFPETGSQDSGPEVRKDQEIGDGAAVQDLLTGPGHPPSTPIAVSVVILADTGAINASDIDNTLRTLVQNARRMGLLSFISPTIVGSLDRITALRRLERESRESTISKRKRPLENKKLPRTL